MRDTVLPLSEAIQGKDGKIIEEIAVPKGTRIQIGVYASNRSKAIWGDDAYEWKPERWLEKLPDEVTNARIPGIYSHL